MQPYPYYTLEPITDLKMLIEKRAAERPDETAFFYADHAGAITKKTYREFLDDVNALGTWMFSKNIRETHVALIGENSYEWIVSYFAVINGGNTAVPLDSRLPEANIRELLSFGECTSIFYSEKFSAVAAALPQEAGYPLSSFTEWIRAGRMLIESGETEFVHYPVDRKKMAALVFTSGTTGKSKGVMLSQENLAEDVNFACRNFVLEGTAMTLLPLHHMFGLGMGVFGVLNYAYPVFINQGIRNIARDFQLAKPQTIFAVPMIVESFYKQFRILAKKSGGQANPEMIRQFFGGRLQNIICGGAPLDPMYVEAFRNFGITVLNGYGITECSPVVAVNRNKDWRDGSVGRVLPGCTVKIAENGEILIRGNNVMLGYYHNEEATKEALEGGWFHTGDLGKIDEDGYFYITGRIKNLIITSSGENISPEEMENQILHDPAVAETVVFGKDNVLAAVIVPDKTAGADRTYFEKMLDRINEGQPAYRQIKQLIIRTEPFLRNSTGKIVRAEAVYS